MSTVYHGALDYGELARLGVSPEEVVDFSSNCNPFGPPPAVVEAIRSLSPAALARYPDRHSLALRSRLAQLHHVEPSWIAVGNGSAELIWAIARAFLRENDKTLIMMPTFGEYAAASAASGAEVIELFRHTEQITHGKNGPPLPRSSPNPSFIRVCFGRGGNLAFISPLSQGWERGAGGVRAGLSKLVWLCNPNNPTGYLWAPEALRELREAFPDAIFIIDEAYLPFVPEAIPSQPDEQTIILRSLTKDFGMAGIRLGYFLAAPKLVAQVRALLPPWSVSATAQAAGLAALDSLAWREETLTIVRQEGMALRSALEAQGWQIEQGSVPFFLLKADSFGYNGSELRAKLLQKGLVVRDCASFGLPEWVRIAPQHREENERLVYNLSLLRGASNEKVASADSLSRQ